MNCKEVLELYQRYLDKELGDGKSDSVKEHVNSCKRCKKVLIIERQFKSIIVKKINRDKAPAKLKEKIKAQIFRHR